MTPEKAFFEPSTSPQRETLPPLDEVRKVYLNLHQDGWRAILEAERQTAERMRDIAHIAIDPQLSSNESSTTTSTVEV